MTRTEYETIMNKLAEINVDIVFIAEALDLDLMLDVEEEEDE